MIFNISSELEVPYLIVRVQDPGQTFSLSPPWKIVYRALVSPHHTKRTKVCYRMYPYISYPPNCLKSPRIFTSGYAHLPSLPSPPAEYGCYIALNATCNHRSHLSMGASAFSYVLRGNPEEIQYKPTECRLGYLPSNLSLLPISTGKSQLYDHFLHGYVPMPCPGTG